MAEDDGDVPFDQSNDDDTNMIVTQNLLHQLFQYTQQMQNGTDNKLNYSLSDY